MWARILESVDKNLENENVWWTLGKYKKRKRTKKCESTNQFDKILNLCVLRQFIASVVVVVLWEIICRIQVSFEKERKMETGNESQA